MQSLQSFACLHIKKMWTNLVGVMCLKISGPQLLNAKQGSQTNRFLWLLGKLGSAFAAENKVDENNMRKPKQWGGKKL